jgi:hypothetical protein
MPDGPSASLAVALRAETRIRGRLAMWLGLRLVRMGARLLERYHVDVRIQRGPWSTVGAVKASVGLDVVKAGGKS